MLVAVGIMLPLLYGLIPLSNQPVSFLENRIQPVDLAGRDIDGIIVLGGFTGDGFVAENRNQPTLGSAAERFTAALHWHSAFEASIVPHLLRGLDAIYGQFQTS